MEGPRLGTRLWLYTNFDCNLACDYCCAESAPNPLNGRRRLSVDVAQRAAEEFAGLGGRELLLTGGEPFLHPQLSDIVSVCSRFPPEPLVILTNAMVFERGPRRKVLESLDPQRVILQVSLDSGTPGLHDRHRGAGSFARALWGIRMARRLGYRVKVAATVDPADTADVAALHALLDAEDIEPEDRLVRPVARVGFASWGLQLSAAELAPEPTLAADGAWWHPVAVADPTMKISSSPLPVATVFAVVRAALNAQGDRGAALHSFRCT
jgi:MoaA/NifB/PqqE/SkfB family radical SAM enzyme